MEKENYKTSQDYNSRKYNLQKQKTEEAIDMHNALQAKDTNILPHKTSQSIDYDNKISNSMQSKNYFYLYVKILMLFLFNF